MPRSLCLYHKNCLDGSAAAAVVQRKEPDVELIPVQYGTQPPVVEGRRVYLVDFGWPIEAMRQLKAQASELIWIDHHSSQEPIWRTLGWGVFELNECAASLTWQTLFPQEPLPAVLGYVRDKDLWRWQLTDSRAICAGLSEAFTNSKVDGLLQADLAAMAERGRPLIAAQQERILATARTGVLLTDALGVPGLRALAVNCFQDQNEVGDYICRTQADGGLGYDLAILYYRKGNGTWVHSLRSKGGEVDCARIAAERGGGGHPTSGCFLAAGPVVGIAQT